MSCAKFHDDFFSAAWMWAEWKFSSKLNYNGKFVCETGPRLEYIRVLNVDVFVSKVNFNKQWYFSFGMMWNANLSWCFLKKILNIYVLHKYLCLYRVPLQVAIWYVFMHFEANKRTISTNYNSSKITLFHGGVNMLIVSLYKYVLNTYIIICVRIR